MPTGDQTREAYSQMVLSSQITNYFVLLIENFMEVRMCVTLPQKIMFSIVWASCIKSLIYGINLHIHCTNQIHIFLTEQTLDHVLT